MELWPRGCPACGARRYRVPSADRSAGELDWSCGREAEGGGLLNRYTVEKPYRGFESLRLRQHTFPFIINGLRDLPGLCKPRITRLYSHYIVSKGDGRESPGCQFGARCLMHSLLSIMSVRLSSGAKRHSERAISATTGVKGPNRWFEGFVHFRVRSRAGETVGRSADRAPLSAAHRAM